MITQIDPFSEPIFLGDGGHCPPFEIPNAMHAPCPWADLMLAMVGNAHPTALDGYDRCRTPCHFSKVKAEPSDIVIKRMDIGRIGTKQLVALNGFATRAWKAGRGCH
jgi:hypothetical protein